MWIFVASAIGVLVMGISLVPGGNLGLRTGNGGGISGLRGLRGFRDFIGAGMIT